MDTRTILLWVLVVVYGTHNVLSCETSTPAPPPPPPPDTTAPTMRCSGHLGDFRAPIHQRHAVVTWSTPTATDNRCSASSITITKQSPSAGSGSAFGKGPHKVTYSARDCNGQTAHCSFGFNVIVTECGVPSFPANGNVQCDYDMTLYPVWGDICAFSCNVGYQMAPGEAFQQTCGSGGSWSGGGTIVCNKIPCDEPKVHRSLNGGETCTDGYLYDSVCVYQCRPGQGVPPGGNNVIRCLATGTWDSLLTPCTDVDPPVFNPDTCPGLIYVYADQGKLTTSVTWDLPEATDTKDGPVAVTQTEGSPPGAEFEIGLHEIVYSAKDEANNEAIPCWFVIGVTDICPAGTFSMDGECLPCPSDTSQNETGSRPASCHQCPEGKVARSRQITQESDCIDAPGENKTCEEEICNGQPCQLRLDGPVCSCQMGYSGETCEVPPDLCTINLCRNGATCEINPNKTIGYKCVCTDEYKGRYCSKRRSIGEWTPWSEYSPCNVDCGGGVMTRTRECINPDGNSAPVPCPGEAIEEVECGTRECPAICLIGEFHNGLFCQQCPLGKYQDEAGQASCKDCPQGTTRRKGSDSINDCIVCPKGQFLNDNNCEKCPRGTYQDRQGGTTCTPCDEGLTTRKVGSTKSSKCVASLDLLPVAVEGLIQVLYEYQDCTKTEGLSEIQEEFTKVLKTWGKKAVCKSYSELCEIGKVVVSCAPVESRRKRSENSQVELGAHSKNQKDYSYRASVVFDTTLGIKYPAHFNANQTYHYVNAMWAQIEEDLKEDIEKGEFNLKIEESEADPVSYSTGSTHLLCEPGEEMDYKTFICKLCGSGTVLEGDTCVPCSVGTYQGQEGQSTCTPCPEGQTTMWAGSIAKENCLDKASMEQLTEQLPFILGVTLGALGLIIVVFIVIIILMYKRKAVKPSLGVDTAQKPPIRTVQNTGSYSMDPRVFKISDENMK